MRRRWPIPSKRVPCRRRSSKSSSRSRKRSPWSPSPSLPLKLSFKHSPTPRRNRMFPICRRLLRWSKRRSQLISQASRCRKAPADVADSQTAGAPDDRCRWRLGSGTCEQRKFAFATAPEGPLKENAITNNTATQTPGNLTNSTVGNRSDWRIVGPNPRRLQRSGSFGPRCRKRRPADRLARRAANLRRSYGVRSRGHRPAARRIARNGIGRASGAAVAARSIKAPMAVGMPTSLARGMNRPCWAKIATGPARRPDSAVTGLALLAFLGAGNTHVQGDYAKNVQRGLEFLISIQGADGNLAGEAETFAYMYSHGMATLAMSEAYAMTGDKRLEPTVQKAINYTLRAQIRPRPAAGAIKPSKSRRQRGDTSQLGWQLMSVKSAELAGLQVPGSAADGAVKFLKSVASGLSGGKASYRPGEAPSRTMTAEALVCKQFLGMARENPASNEAGDYLMSQLPGADKINLYYWYYGTLGMYQLQGEYWRRWNEALQSTWLAVNASTAMKPAVGIPIAFGEATAVGFTVPRSRCCAWKCIIAICQSTPRMANR